MTIYNSDKNYFCSTHQLDRWSGFSQTEALEEAEAETPKTESFCY